MGYKKGSRYWVMGNGKTMKGRKEQMAPAQTKEIPKDGSGCIFLQPITHYLLPITFFV
jgi:hypothetical protein